MVEIIVWGVFIVVAIMVVWAFYQNVRDDGKNPGL